MLMIDHIGHGLAFWTMKVTDGGVKDGLLAYNVNWKKCQGDYRSSLH